jgi:hypothetical protein
MSDDRNSLQLDANASEPDGWQREGRAMYFRNLADATRATPGQENVLKELEDLRKQLGDILSRIRSVDDEQLKAHYEQLASELVRERLQLLPTIYMSRAAN